MAEALLVTECILVGLLGVVIAFWTVTSLLYGLGRGSRGLGWQLHEPGHMSYKTDPAIWESTWTGSVGDYVCEGISLLFGGVLLVGGVGSVLILLHGLGCYFLGWVRVLNG